MKQILAEFYFRDTAEKAIQVLSDFGFDRQNVAIVARGLPVENRSLALLDSEDYLHVWKEFLDLCGSKWTDAEGPTVIFVPELGCVFFAGWIVRALRDGLNLAAFARDLGSVGAILSSVGVPNEFASAHEASVKRGCYLVVVRGSVKETTIAMSLLAPLGATGLEVSDHRFAA